MKTLDDLRQGVVSWRDSLTDGWERLRRSASGTLTRFRPGSKTDLPARDEIDGDLALPDMGWGLIGGDVFEDERRVVVRLEAPGLEKHDFEIEVDETRRSRCAATSASSARAQKDAGVSCSAPMAASSAASRCPHR